MDCLSYRRTFSLERQAFSQVARQVAEGSGWTTSTATDTRRACPRGMKALSCDAKLAGSKSPRKEKARFCRVVFFCRRLCDANIEVSPQPRQLSLRASPASRESELEGLQVLQAACGWAFSATAIAVVPTLYRARMSLIYSCWRLSGKALNSWKVMRLPSLTE